MSRNADFMILNTSTELIGKHMNLTSFEQHKGADLEPSLIKAYKTAETALMVHIKQEVQQIKDIDILTQFFRESCYAIGALSLRYNLVKKKLIGKPSTGAEELKKAIEEGIEEDDDYYCFPHFGTRCGNSKGFGLSNEAFEHGVFGACETDKRALVTMVLLDFVLSTGYTGLKVATVVADLEFSCAKMLFDDATKDMSVIGYYEGYDFVFDHANKEFIGLFAGTLKKLMAQTESAQVLEMKQYMQDQVILAWTGSSITKPMEVYTEIEKLISTNKTSKEVAPDVVNDLIHSRDFAVYKRFSSAGVRYELNAEGLKAFADLLEVLGLSDLQEVPIISDKIRAVCA